MPSVLVPFVACAQQILDTDFPGTLAQGPDACNGAVYLGLPTQYFGNHARDCAAMPGYHNGLTPLHVIEKLGEMDFCFRGFGSLAWPATRTIGRFDWLI